MEGAASVDRLDFQAAAARVRERIDHLAGISDEPGVITRTFLSRAMREANRVVAGWMDEAGMAPRVDSAGNVCGTVAGPADDAPVLLSGSHLDTVRNAGRFDGILGVLVPIAAFELLSRSGWHPAFGLMHYAFSDEEGVRFQAGCLGSKAVCGLLGDRELMLKDAGGQTLRQVLEEFNGGVFRPPSLPDKNLLGYVEVHIEQGPELERSGHAVAAVPGINGQKRIRASFRGLAGHAGTTPMGERKDAFLGAARFALDADEYAREAAGLVVTIGTVELKPGAGNVIPGGAEFSIDVRHADGATLETACDNLKSMLWRVAGERGLECAWQVVDAQRPVVFAESLTSQLDRAMERAGIRPTRVRSGAGHDAMVMAGICDAAMLFVRCRRGVSHHPDEYVSAADIAVLLRVYCEFLLGVGR